MLSIYTKYKNRHDIEKNIQYLIQELFTFQNKVKYLQQCCRYFCFPGVISHNQTDSKCVNSGIYYESSRSKG